MEPSFIIHHFTGPFRAVVISQHNAGALDQDLAIVSNSDLDICQKRTHRTEFHPSLFPAVKSNSGGSFGKSVSLQHRHPGCPVDPRKAWMKRCTSANDELDMTSHRLSPFPEK